jgi:hypothetical protein
VSTGQTSALSWTADNATSCTASGAWSGNRPAAGSSSVSQTLPGNYSYGMTCSGAGGSASAQIALNVTGPVATNAVMLAVDRGPASSSFNVPFVSVTVCVPGTADCRTVDHVMVDTGSYGLRLFSSALGSGFALPNVTTPAGTPVNECAQFVSGYMWGPVRRADVKLGAKLASNLPMQVVADDGSSAATPAACSDTGPNFGSLAALGANGILGVGLFYRDCAACNTSTAPNVYFACSGNTCSSTTLPYESQVANPVPAFATDNNGVVMSLPAVAPGGATALYGQLIFGIGTQSNNQLGAAKVYAADDRGNFKTQYNGVTYSASFIDSGSNGLFYADTLPVCGGFYCPSSTVRRSATMTAATGLVSGAVDFDVESITALGFGTAAANVGGKAMLSKSFIWGLPFFYGRNVFVAVKGSSTPAGLGPYWAY